MMKLWSDGLHAHGVNGRVMRGGVRAIAATFALLALASGGLSLDAKAQALSPAAQAEEERRLRELQDRARRQRLEDFRRERRERQERATRERNRAVSRGAARAARRYLDTARKTRPPETRTYRRPHVQSRTFRRSHACRVWKARCKKGSKAWCRWYKRNC